MICARVCMQEARLAECERMLVAMDLAMWLNDDSAAVQAVVSCYGLLAPLIFHQITCNPVVQVCKTSSIQVLILTGPRDKGQLYFVYNVTRYKL